MTFKVLIIEDNHSFIDSLKVMLRDLPLDFSHAFRYNDALAIMEKSGIFHNRPVASSDAATESAPGENAAVAPEPVKKRGGHDHKPYHEGGVFLVIVEQNTESSMKGTDFIAHAVRKFPHLAESDFVLLTHRIELVPAKNYNFPILEKPLRAPQIRQWVQQKLKQAQDLIEAQIQAQQQKDDRSEKPAAASKPARKGLRDLLKINRASEDQAVPQAEEKKSAKKSKGLKPAKKTTAPAKKAKPK